jgi:preprotein translocase subunit SecA
MTAPALLSNTWVRPGPLWGPYPERTEAPAPWRWLLPPVHALHKRWLLQRAQPLFLKALQQCLLEPKAPSATTTPINNNLQTPAGAARALAALVPVVQQHLGLVPHTSQHLAAWLLLQGALVEMATGEGKTLATFMAAAVAAQTGTPVHVLTANDYLARRDAEHLQAAYAAVGVRVAWVQSSSTEAERRVAYAADVTYAPAREVAFDHLRDRLRFGRPSSGLGWLARQADGAAEGVPTPRLRGLCLALIDEADAVLCDEARVPLIIAGPSRDSVATTLPAASLQAVLAAARALQLGTDVHLTANATTVQLTAQGRNTLARLPLATDRHLTQGLGADARWREDWVHRALTALHTLHLGRHYLIQEEQVVLVDPLTGRAALERQWSRGVHQLLAAKEGLPLPMAHDTLAQMTYRRLVARYHHVAGLSGTLAEVRWDMALHHGLPVLPVPRHRPSRLNHSGLTLCSTRSTWLATVCERVMAAHTRGQPVLVGTDSVADSNALATELRAKGRRAVVLNAEQHQLEHSVIANAGQMSRITLSTQMAGRGTDIVLGPEVAALGGLHVVACGMHHGRRHWRQLVGRAGRQGDAGSAETILMVGTGVMARYLPAWLLSRAVQHPALGFWAWRLAQIADEWAGTQERRQLSAQDRAWNQRLAYSGPQE